MLYFPQLITGATTQLPCTKRVLQRTVVNQPAGGAPVKLFDPGACAVQWEMQLRGLAQEEWAAVDALFDAVEGRLGAFLFLDPFGNLLTWSESLDAAVWTKDAGVQLSSGAAGPAGTGRATRLTNTGAGDQGIRQTVNVPGSFQYCLSVWARSAAPTRARLFMTSGGDTASQVFKTSTTWRRLEFSKPPGATATGVTFGALVEAGSEVELFGPQAEPQAGASQYKPTTTHSGVFSNAYFLDDELRMTSSAPGEFSCTVRIGANAS